MSLASRALSLLLFACSACGGAASPAVSGPATSNSSELTGVAAVPPPNIAPRTVKIRFKIEPAEAAGLARITMYGRPVSDPQDFVVGMGSVVHVTAEGYRDFEGTYAPSEAGTITLELEKR